MATYSTSLKLTLLANGEGAGTWGQTTNTNLGTLLEQAITGVQNITMTDANYTLTNLNGLSDESRNQVLVVGGTNTAQRDIIAPLVNKTYIVQNSTSGSQAIRVIGSSGSGVIVPNGMTAIVYCNGTSFFPVINGSTGNFTVNNNLSVLGNLTGTTGSFSGAVSSVGSTLTNPTITGATITGAAITPRVVSITSSSSITPTSATADNYVVTALAAPATILAPSGSPVDGQQLILRIKDNGTARALTWTTTSGAYRAIGSALPSSTLAGKVLYVGLVYNSQDTFWDVLGVAQQA